MSSRFDAVIVGGGHNGLVAATMLARADRKVVVLERREQVGGAAVSGAPWPGVGVRLSRYSYLVSLFPRALMRELKLDVELRSRRIPFYAPGCDARDKGLERLHRMLRRVGERLFPTLTEPLLSREQLRAVVDDGEAWEALFERPLSELLEAAIASDELRGVALTDALIGTFASANDPLLRQNRCFLYHVTGNGTGRWDVPVGGMGALSEALRGAARRQGAELRTQTEVVSILTDGSEAEVRCADGTSLTARHVVANVAPSILCRLMDEPSDAQPEGSQLKINMLLSRLPPVREHGVSSEQAFTGTFHINESYEQLQTAFEQAQLGEIPELPPCEVYCHSLTDPSILSAELRAAGAQTLTLFGLHMPARLFEDPGAKQRAVAATLRSVNSVLAGPIEECLWSAHDGSPCLEALTPPELERELGLPRGHIFHRDLSWPFADSEEEVGSWGVETAHPNVWLGGAGAKRGGGVSGIPGHNAARAVLGAG